MATTATQSRLPLRTVTACNAVRSIQFVWLRLHCTRSRPISCARGAARQPAPHTASLAPRCPAAFCQTGGTVPSPEQTGELCRSRLLLFRNSRPIYAPEYAAGPRETFNTPDRSVCQPADCPALAYRPRPAYPWSPAECEIACAPRRRSSALTTMNRFSPSVPFCLKRAVTA